MCLGRRFADLEMQILLAKVSPIHSFCQELRVTCKLFVIFSLNFFQLLRTHKMEYNYQALDYAVAFMYGPKGKLKFKMTKRME